MAKTSAPRFAPVFAALRRGRQRSGYSATLGNARSTRAYELARRASVCWNKDGTHRRESFQRPNVHSFAKISAAIARRHRGNARWLCADARGATLARYRQRAPLPARACEFGIDADAL